MPIIQYCNPCLEKEVILHNQVYWFLIIFYNSDKSIYIPLINKFPSKIDCLRKVIEVTRKSIDGKNNVDSILSKVGIALSTSDIEYQKNTKYSFGECVVIIYKLLLKNEE